MPADKINFYENQQEASMRLRKTIVLYDGEPYIVCGISDHKGDGKLRIYLDKMGYNGIGRSRDSSIPNYWDYDPHQLGHVLDEWIQNNPDKGIVRKYLGAAGFNKFRPFPLGNMNVDGRVVYVERTPTRNTFQGLRNEALIGQLVSVSPNQADNRGQKSTMYQYSSYARNNGVNVDIYHPSFYDCIMGNFPTYAQVIAALTDPEVTNTGAAFDREFSVMRGPLGMLFLCYQTEGVGLLDGPDSRILRLGSEYKYLKEKLEELNVFTDITIQE